VLYVSNIPAGYRDSVKGTEIDNNCEADDFDKEDLIRSIADLWDVPIEGLKSLY
jgi:hypothetical protein